MFVVATGQALGLSSANTTSSLESHSSRRSGSAVDAVKLELSTNAQLSSSALTQGVTATDNSEEAQADMRRSVRGSFVAVAAALRHATASMGSDGTDLVSLASELKPPDEAKQIARVLESFVGGDGAKVFTLRLLMETRGVEPVSVAQADGSSLQAAEVQAAEAAAQVRLAELSQSSSNNAVLSSAQVNESSLSAAVLSTSGEAFAVSASFDSGGDAQLSAAPLASAPTTGLVIQFGGSSAALLSQVSAAGGVTAATPALPTTSSVETGTAPAPVADTGHVDLTV